MLGLVERRDLRVIMLNGCHMIRHDVYHHPETHGVSFGHEGLQSILITKV